MQSQDTYLWWLEPTQAQKQSHWHLLISSHIGWPLEFLGLLYGGVSVLITMFIWTFSKRLQIPVLLQLTYLFKTQGLYNEIRLLFTVVWPINFKQTRLKSLTFLNRSGYIYCAIIVVFLLTFRVFLRHVESPSIQSQKIQSAGSRDCAHTALQRGMTRMTTDCGKQDTGYVATGSVALLLCRTSVWPEWLQVDVHTL